MVVISVSSWSSAPFITVGNQPPGSREIFLDPSNSHSTVTKQEAIKIKFIQTINDKQANYFFVKNSKTICNTGLVLSFKGYF